MKFCQHFNVCWIEIIWRVENYYSNFCIETEIETKKKIGFDFFCLKRTFLDDMKSHSFLLFLFLSTFISNILKYFILFLLSNNIFSLSSFFSPSLSSFSLLCHFLSSFLLLLLLRLENFPHQSYLMVFHWSLSDNKYPQVSRILPNILVNLNYSVAWIISNHPLISKSSSPFTNFRCLPKVPITTGIIVTFMFHSFFNSQARSRYLS